MVWSGKASLRRRYLGRGSQQGEGLPQAEGIAGAMTLGLAHLGPSGLEETVFEGQ